MLSLGLKFRVTMLVGAWHDEVWSSIDLNLNK